MVFDPTHGNELSDETLEIDSSSNEHESSSNPQVTETYEHESDSLPPGVTKRIGQYRIKRAIASGGMGTVYEAVQEKPRRTVAVKLMRAGIASRSALRRFEYESQLLARLRHNGIAQVYDAGTHRDGEVTVPYFAMEYIVGAKPITDYVCDKKLGARERIKLVIDVCEAVHHGHQKGIIHRDLKPSNILVDSSGQVKVIDFGVARSTDSDMVVTTLQTDVGQLVGTLQYMSPEQCAADPHDIDTRSDVYALGVILYESLCERLPYDLKGTAIHEATRVICEQQPPRLSTIDKALRGDVETIVLKALEKDRDRRYQSASALTADLQRYLNNEAISARPPSVMYQLQVFARRNKGFFAAVAAVFVVLVAGVLVSSSLYVKADAARAEAEAARTDATARAAELEEVAKFQEDQLSEIDVPLMGIRMRQGLLDKVRLAAERSGVEDLDGRVNELEALLAGTDFTGLALNLLDQNIFSRAVDTINEQFERQPLVRARLLHALSTSMRESGLLDRADAPLTTAIEIRREALGDDHPDTIDSIHMLGVLRTRQGRTDEGERLIRQAVDAYQRILGNDDARTLDAIGDIGVVLSQKGKEEEAETYFREALEGCRRILGDDHKMTITAINNMGYLLGRLGKPEEALVYVQEAYERNSRLFGEDHPNTLTPLNNVGFMLIRIGKIAEAEPYLRKSLEMHRRVLGDDHPMTLTAVGNMAQLLEKMGKREEAEPYRREHVNTSRRVLGDEHPRTLRAINNMGFLLNTQGKLDEAEGYYRESMNIGLRVMGDTHPDTLISIANLGHLLNMKEQYKAAEEHLRKYEAAARKVWSGNSMGMCGNYLAKLGTALIGQGRFVEAEKTLVEAHDMLVTGFNEKHPRTIKCIEEFINLYESWHYADPEKGYDAKAAEWRAKLPEANEATDHDQ